jgi:hypothetical protein
VKPPLNELERAMIVANRPEGRPEFFRLLRESKLICLVPYHPELVGRQAGRPPRIKIWKQRGVKLVPVFTSEQRAQEAFEKIRLNPREFTLCAMQGHDLFAAIASMDLGFVINPTNAPEVEMDVNAARKLADGSILTPLDPATNRPARIQVVNPADYPTELVQSLFKFLHGRLEIRAAWIFYRLLNERNERAPNEYAIGLLAVGNIEPLKQQIQIVANGAKQPGTTITLATLDLKEPGIAAIVAHYPPFYAAPDFRASGPLSP